ncbi:MAG: gamma carbonic anhydrase family protein [Rubrivivax sp.]|nr:gamma carbonic anhydrase family protein [Rubrivivax sp.]
MALYRFGDDTPQLAADSFVADSAQVIGRVRLAAGSSVWYGAVLRGDNDWITLGARSNIQDGSVLHTDSGMPLTIGEDVTIGHLVMLHGCTVGDGALIGIRAVVLNGATIGRHCLVGAGAVVTEGSVFPDHSLIFGSPARVVRLVSPEQSQRMRLAALHYVEHATRHRTLLQRVG